ncbi:unnamed protein product [Penicillium olsonii]|nr:unnamed protein product [Penicillium olsonii]
MRTPGLPDLPTGPVPSLPAPPPPPPPPPRPPPPPVWRVSSILTTLHLCHELPPKRMMSAYQARRVRGLAALVLSDLRLLAASPKLVVY